MVWIQYSLADGTQTGTNSLRVNDADLASVGKAQIEYNGASIGMMVDITQTPPVVIAAPPTPSPSPAG